MDSLIAAIITVTLILIAGLTIFDASLHAQEEVVQSWQEMEERSEAHARTMMAPISTTVGAAGEYVTVIMKNEGSEKLYDFERWDVLFQYYTDTPTYELNWYPYNAGAAGMNQWTVVGIFTDAATSQSEVYDPGIWNPGEELVVRLELFPSIGMTTTNMMVLGTENGIAASVIITR